MNQSHLTLEEGDPRRRLAVEATYLRTKARSGKHEQRDIHEVDDLLGEAIAKFDGDPHPDWQRVLTGAAIPGSGKMIREIRGMGKVYDWRDSSWTPVSGGRIAPLAFVQHIPVVRNVQGLGDFVTLRNVLVAQNLMVQSATDSEGNAALFTPFDYLCYQARGGNQVTCGCEHMHLTTGEAWSKKQLRAAAWVAQLADDKHNITTQKRASIGSGNGVIRVLARGQTTHQVISDQAGFHDRTDPGPGYDFEYVAHCVRFWDQHGHFDGA